MKPHAIRRGLWLANFGLAAAVLGVAAWYAMEVRPAVAAAVKKRPNNERPKHLEVLRSDYEKMRVSGLKWKPQAPVSDTELNSTILRADYKKKNPTHWVFSGKMPPTEDKTAKRVDNRPPPPTGLDTLGKVSTVIIDPGHSTILFKFKGGKSRAFGVGEFIKVSGKTDPDRFKLTKILEPRPRLYEIHYDVYGKDPKKPERSDVLRYDKTGAAEGYPDFLRPVGTVEPAPSKDDTTPEGANATPGADGSTDGTTDGTTDGSEKPAGGGTAEVVRIARKKPTADLTLDDLKPKIFSPNPARRDQRVVEFDKDTYRYFKGRNAKGVAGTVKTSIAKDKTTGQVIGLRITGFKGAAPSAVFDVRKGDILVSINGKRITSRAEAVRIAESLKDVKVVTVVIDRRGKLVTYKVNPQDPENRRKVRYFEGFSHN